MSSTPVRAAIRDRLAQHFTAAPIVDSVNADVTPDFGPWVTVEFLAGSEELVSVGDPGNNIYREYSTVAIHCFVPVGTGDQTAVEYADQIRAVFRGQSFGGVTVEGVDPPDTSDTPDGLWFRASTSMDVYYDNHG